MKTRVELPIIIETITDEEYIVVINKIENLLSDIDEVVEVEQSIGYEVEE